MKHLSILFLFLFLAAGVRSQKIEFFSEDLTFRLQQETFEVDGLYFFRNTSDAVIHQNMIYPFPDVEKYGEISFISINREGDTNTMLRNQTERGALFMVILQPREEAAYRIIYRQQLKSNEAKYIILTTQKWGKPFETADYKLEFPDSIQLTNISIEPDSTFQKDNQHTYLWHRENFMPTVDFEFEFK
jgi:hypothetical protein